MKAHFFIVTDHGDDPNVTVRVLPPQINVQDGDSVKVQEGLVLEVEGDDIKEVFKKIATMAATVIIATRDKGQLDDSTLKSDVQALFDSLP